MILYTKWMFQGNVQRGLMIQSIFHFSKVTKKVNSILKEQIEMTIWKLRTEMEAIEKNYGESK